MTDNQLILPEDEEKNARLRAEGERIRALMPNGNKLSPNQAVSLAQYSQALDANQYRGEVYGFTDKKGNFKLVDGYKLLIREALRQSPYDDDYTPLSDEALTAEKAPPGSIGYRCRLTRHDKRDGIREYTSLGAKFTEALDVVSTFAVGIVDHKEMYYKNGDPVAPPKGWGWAQVARKRALKNAINLAYAMPTVSELAKRHLQETNTEAEDWEGVTIYKTNAEQTHAAQLNAGDRRRKAGEGLAPEHVQAGREAIYGPTGDDDPLDLVKETEYTHPAIDEASGVDWDDDPPF